MHILATAQIILPFFNSLLLLILVCNSTFMRRIYGKVYPQHVGKKKVKEELAAKEAEENAKEK